ncbi:MAG: xanthine dehydrogenase family protein [Polyangiaceae bacterium]|nr:xanthine dehydrogenase family protein [Polyangiaceae bacterium]
MTAPNEKEPKSAGVVGKSISRSDGVAKVLGTARYVDDLPALPGEIHGATVRSPVPRGRIRSVRFDPSFDWSDVIVVQASDVPVNVVALIADDQPVLAAKQVNHAYEPIVLLACADRRKLTLAKLAVHLDIEPLVPVLDVATALEGSNVVWTAPAGFGEPNTNVVKRYVLTKGEVDVDAELARCAHVLSGAYSTHHQEQLYIEPQGVLSWWDDDGVHLVGSMQCPFYVHKALVKAFALEPHQVDVAQAVTGGGFGGKEEYPSILAIHAALLSRKSGRPVRMIYDRTEDIEATTKRHPCLCEITTGCDADGTLRVLKMRVVMDAGAYVTLTPVVLSRGLLHAAGTYRWPNVFMEAIAVATNTPPNGAFRGFGAPQTIWAIERHMDALAAYLGTDPMVLKRKNVLVEGDTTATGQLLRTSVSSLECLDKGSSASRYVERRAEIEKENRRRAQRGERKRLGIGASIFMHGAGFTGSGERVLQGKAAVDLLPGGRLRIRTASTDIGQGTETVFRQIASDACGVAVEDIDFAVPSTKVVPNSGPTVASRTVMVVGSVVEACAREIGDRVKTEQVEQGGTFAEAADRLLVKEGSVTALHQYEPPPFVHWDDEAYKGDAYPCFAWMCDVAEVEVDLDTFETDVKKLYLIGDVGKAIHPTMCKGQLEGGSLQAMGWALFEEVVWKDGLIQNPRMTNYIIPTALDAPVFDTTLVECPFPYGPGGGAKGIGELPMDGGAPAIAAAVEHATGIAVHHLPLTPERLFEASLGRLSPTSTFHPAA